MKYLLCAAAAFGLLAGCGGGGSGGRALPAMPGSGAMQTTKITFALTVGPKTSSKKRRPSYVSYSTNGVAIYAVPHGGNLDTTMPLTTDVSSGSAACNGATGNPRTCNAYSNAPAGNDDFRIVLYDAPPKDSSTPAGAIVGTVDMTAGTVITPGQNNPITVVPNAVISSLSLAYGQSVVSIPQDGTKYTISLPVSANDADGNVITGPGNYITPVNLAIGNDPNGALALSQTRITAPPASGITMVTLSYDTSKSLTAGTITASAGGPAPAGTTASFSVVPLIVSPTTISLNANQTAKITVSEPGYSGLFTATSSDTNKVTVDGPYSAASAGAQVTFTAHSVNGGAATIAISDQTNSKLSVAASVTVTTAALSIPGAPTMTDFPVPASLQSVNSISTDGSGHVWMNGHDFANHDVMVSVQSNGAMSGYPFQSANVVGNAFTGPDGNVWFRTWNSQQNTSNLAEWLNGSIVDFPAIATGGVGVNAGAVTGRDGNIWWADIDGNAMVRIVVSGSGLTTTRFPAFHPVNPVVGPDGNVWFIEYNNGKLARITPNGVVSEYMGFANNLAHASLGMLTSGSDGNLWLGDSSGTSNLVARVTPSGTITEYTAPEADVAASAGPDGNIWFCGDKDGLLRVTSSGIITRFATPKDEGCFNLLAGGDGALWALSGTQKSLIKVVP